MLLTIKKVTTDSKNHNLPMKYNSIDTSYQISLERCCFLDRKIMTTYLKSKHSNKSFLHLTVNQRSKSVYFEEENYPSKKEKLSFYGDNCPNQNNCIETDKINFLRQIRYFIPTKHQKRYYSSNSSLPSLWKNDATELFVSYRIKTYIGTIHTNLSEIIEVYSDQYVTYQTYSIEVRDQYRRQSFMFYEDM